MHLRKFRIPLINKEMKNGSKKTNLEKILRFNLSMEVNIENIKMTVQLSYIHKIEEFDYRIKLQN